MIPGLIWINEMGVHKDSLFSRKITEEKASLLMVCVLITTKEKTRKPPNHRLKHDGGDSAIKIDCTHLEVGSDPGNDLVPPAAS